MRLHLMLDRGPGPCPQPGAGGLFRTSHVPWTWLVTCARWEVEMGELGSSRDGGGVEKVREPLGSRAGCLSPFHSLCMDGDPCLRPPTYPNTPSLGEGLCLPSGWGAIAIKITAPSHTWGLPSWGAYVTASLMRLSRGLTGLLGGFAWVPRPVTVAEHCGWS